MRTDSQTPSHTSPARRQPRPGAFIVCAVSSAVLLLVGLALVSRVFLDSAGKADARVIALEKRVADLEGRTTILDPYCERAGFCRQRLLMPLPSFPATVFPFPSRGIFIAVPGPHCGSQCDIIKEKEDQP